MKLAFPTTGGGRWQVSNGWGSQPRWSPNGCEIFFLDGGAHLNAAQVVTTPTFGVSGVVRLFDVSRFVLDPFHQSYDVTPDGRSFILLSPSQQGAVGRPLRLVWVDHWFNDLRARMSR
jgi:hypothetical protein